MIRNILIHIIILSVFRLGISQQYVVNQEAIEMPKEDVYIHHNTSLLFAGEYMYYTFYCTNSQTKNLSTLSKIGYIELVSEDKKIVLKQKVKLEQGVGQGDFFLPIAIESGNYKLIGYTQWMRNGAISSLFQSDISIINPYRGNQKRILSDSGKTAVNNPIKISNPTHTNSNTISFVTNKKDYKKREKVAVHIKGDVDLYKQGHYSISVRKIDTINIPARYSSKTYNRLKLNKTSDKKLKSSVNHILIPELRGELICGEIRSTIATTAIHDKKVGISIPGREYEIKIVSTDTDGSFCFTLDKQYLGDTVFIQLIGNPEKYDISLKEKQPINYDDLMFHKFRITPAMKKMILDRSFYNQVQNAYFSLKPDTLVTLKKIKPFYGDQVTVFKLDDYTRFPTIKETLVEVINNAWIKKLSDENSIFQVRYKYPPYNGPDHLPLVIVDGIIIQDHTKIIEYDARKVKKITLSRDKHFLGEQIFEGILDFETIDGDFYKTLDIDYIKKFQLSKTLPKKKYYNQYHGLNSKTDKTPDFRLQLLWEPDFKINTIEPSFDFFTSDNTGTYEIVMEGYSNTGQPVSLRELITVN
ncbi:hypothetical protein [Aquimarina sp. RZ0]|uniref:hypothetical protein n=1 Tax=Aquimarina sp. RZ0 TaxID=2607730 RepID=UPI0011F23941|nr:hypothetical protein [Aquimarina sp. RZ0]KAA1246785.1 hypothetical protein F0000_05860 [Aquimarina sp. RZ0]